MSTAQVTFKISVGRYNGTMGLRLLVNNNPVFEQSNFDVDCIEPTVDIVFPSVLTLEVYNKGPLDTEVNAQGEILADKFLLINDIIVDRMSLGNDLLYKLITLNTLNGTFKGPYLGVNGSVTIDFNCKNSFIWLLMQKSKLTDQEKEFFALTGNDCYTK